MGSRYAAVTQPGGKRDMVWASVVPAVAGALLLGGRADAQCDLGSEMSGIAVACCGVNMVRRPLLLCGGGASLMGDPGSSLVLT